MIIEPTIRPKQLKPTFKFGIDRNEHGWIYGGLSKETNTDLWLGIFPEEDPRIMNFYQALQFTQNLTDFHGKNSSKTLLSAKDVGNPYKQDGGIRLATWLELFKVWDTSAKQKIQLYELNISCLTLSRSASDYIHAQNLCDGSRNGLYHTMFSGIVLPVWTAIPNINLNY